MVPGLVSTPQPAQDLAAQFPNLSGTNAAISQNIQAGLGGQVSPATLNALRGASAAWGWASGMPALDLPGSLNWHNLYGNIAGFAENQAQQAMQNYAKIIPTISQTQTVTPELQTQIASMNALNLAAPNPQQAASYAQKLFDQYLSRTRGGGYPTYQGPSGFGGPTAPTGPTTGRFYDPNAPTQAYHSLATDTLTGGMPTGDRGQGPIWMQPGMAQRPTGQPTADEQWWAQNMGFDLPTLGRTDFGGVAPPVAQGFGLPPGLSFAPTPEQTPYRGVEYSGVTPYQDLRPPTPIGGTGSAYNFEDIMRIDPSRRAAADVSLGQQLYGSDQSLDAWAEDVGV
jgi:hypothetical protein